MKTTQHSKPLIIGLTGSIGSGKSTAAEILAQKYSLPLLDADVLAREVVQPATPGLEEIKSTFGDDFVLSSGELNRSKLGQLIFSDPGARKLLEGILHPRIRKLYLERLEALVQTSNKRTLAIIYVVPLLYEAAYDYPELDYTVCVYATEQICVERIMDRNNLTRSQAEERYRAQIPMEEKRARADFVIENTGTLAELEREVAGFVDWLRKRSRTQDDRDTM